MITIEPGAEVAVRIGLDDSHLRFRRIERLTDTLIILDDGERFQRHGAHYQVGARHGNRHQIVDATDPTVINALARTLYREVGNTAHAVMHGAGATLHRKGAREVLGELAKLEEQIRLARAEIERRQAAAR